MSAAIKLVTARDEVKQDAKQLLTEAIGRDFESVLVIGWKDGKVQFNNSASLDAIKIIGALETAKMNYYSTWNTI